MVVMQSMISLKMLLLVLHQQNMRLCHLPSSWRRNLSPLNWFSLCCTAFPWLMRPHPPLRFVRQLVTQSSIVVYTIPYCMYGSAAGLCAVRPCLYHCRDWGQLKFFWTVWEGLVTLLSSTRYLDLENCLRLFAGKCLCARGRGSPTKTHTEEQRKKVEMHVAYIWWSLCASSLRSAVCDVLMILYYPAWNLIRWSKLCKMQNISCACIFLWL